MARITAFGQTGPLRQGPGYAAIASAFGGTWYVNGPADRPPARPTPVYPDYLTGLFTAFGVMAALRHRDATGEGQWIDAALYESAFRIMEYTTTFYGRQGVVRERGGLQHAGWPGGAFETLDHRWIVFTAPAQHLFERLCVMLGQPDLPNDPRFAGATERPKHIDVILEMAGRWFARRAFDKAMDELDRKSTRLNSSHSQISYAVFCLKKKNSSPRQNTTPLKADHHTAGRHPPDNLEGTIRLEW